MNRFIFLSLVTVNIACDDSKDTDNNLQMVEASEISTSDFTAAGKTKIEKNDVYSDLRSFKEHKIPSGMSMSGLSLHSESSKFSPLELVNGFTSTTLSVLNSSKSSPDSFALTDNSADMGKCIMDFLMDKMVINSSGEDLVLKMTADLSECAGSYFEKMFGDQLNIDDVSAVASAYSKSICPGADFSSLDGKTVKEMMETIVANKGKNTGITSACGDAENAPSIVRKFSMNLKFSASKDSKYIKMNLLTKDALMSSEGGMCEFSISDQTIAAKNCQYKELKVTENITSDGTTVESELFSADLSKIKGKIGGKYFNDGGIPVSYNGWDGKITLSPADRGRFELSNGEQSAKGSLINGDTSYTYNPVERLPREEPHEEKKTTVSLKQATGTTLHYVYSDAGYQSGL